MNPNYQLNSLFFIVRFIGLCLFLGASVHSNVLAGEQDDARAVANSNVRLGALAVEEKNYTDARWYYRTALERFHDVGDRHQVAITYHRLAMVAKAESAEVAGKERQTLLKEAEEQAHQAIQIHEELDDSSLEIWRTYGLLTEIATIRAEYYTKKIGQWRRKERVAYAKFPTHWASMQSRWEPIVKAIQVAIQGDREIQAAVEVFLEGLVQTQEGAQLAKVSHAVLGGARDRDQLAEEYQLNLEGYLILSKILE